MSENTETTEPLVLKPAMVIALLGDERLFRRLTKYGWLQPINGTRGRGVRYRRDSVITALDRMDVEELPQLED